jgi:cyclopropane-fatty-acyl-phospholipid synthase
MQATTGGPRGASPEAIQSHYDVGDDFYRLWLDPTLSYSCALWEGDEPDDALEAAQVRKIDYHVCQARAAGAARVLDVGCGWGATLRRLVDAHAVGHATGLTLSERQAQRVAAAGHPHVDVRLENWLDHTPAAPYDAVISVGAFEHFARPEWTDEKMAAAYRAFFERCHAWLRPDGWLSLQTIAYGSLDRHQGRQLPEHRFLLHEVFPETDLPALGQIAAASHGLFEVMALRNDRDDYRRTCRVWFARLLARRAEAGTLVGEEVVARYLRYLKLSATLFYYGQTALLRITFRRLDHS